MASWTSSMAFELNSVLPTKNQKSYQLFSFELWEWKINSKIGISFVNLKCKCKKTCIWSMNDFWEKQIQKNRNFELENCQSWLRDRDYLGQIGGHMFGLKTICVIYCVEWYFAPNLEWFCLKANIVLLKFFDRFEISKCKRTYYPF